MTRQKVGNHAGAVPAFLMVLLQGNADPSAALLAAESYLALGQLNQSLEAINSAADWAQNSPEPNTIVARAQALFESIERQVDSTVDVAS
jgi:hypothetical protein